MNETFTLERLLHLGIQFTESGSFSITAKDSNGYVMNPNELVSYLFFNNEHSLYGLLTETNDENVILRADQLLTIISGNASIC